MTDRAQTTLDFAIGMSVFLGVVVFAFGIVPTMFAPFDSDTGTDAVVSDRAADRLAADALAESPSSPSILNGTCTQSFFDGSSPGPCRYGTADLHDSLGVGTTVKVNVTISNDSGIRTLGGTRLARGRSPSSVSDVVVARRTVSLPRSLGVAEEREQNRLLVRVW
jgi:hypothetical protein